MVPIPRLSSGDRLVNMIVLVSLSAIFHYISMASSRYLEDISGTFYFFMVQPVAMALEDVASHRFRAQSWFQSIAYV